MPKKHLKAVETIAHERPVLEAAEAKLDVLIAEAKKIRTELRGASERLAQASADCIPEGRKNPKHKAGRLK